MGSSDPFVRARRTPLAVCLSAALALSSAAGSAATPAENLLHHRSGGLAPLFDGVHRRAAAVQATRNGAHRPEGGIVIPVTTCADDAGTGTLRHAVLVASSGDTVDLRALTCGTITLASGAISVDVDDLTIEGPGAARLTIDANHASRVFRHSGAGALYLDDLTVANGSYSPPTGPFGGGCVYSAASIWMRGAVARGCTASGPSTIAGGALFANGSVILFASSIVDSAVVSDGGGGSVTAVGGAAFAGDTVVLEHSIVSGNSATAAAGTVYAGGLGGKDVIAKYSTVHANAATTGTGSYAIGGGLIASGDALLQYTTVDGNVADGGGALVQRTATGYTTTLRNATISSNAARLVAGGMLIDGDLVIENSTIAFNVGGTEGGGGVIAEGASADLESSIIADNSPSGAMAAADLDGAATVTGANNLIKVSGIAVPADTIDTDPNLGPLAANGGETRTHALPPTSIAIDLGNNAAGAHSDQRGVRFPRRVGASPDIGAYELDPEVIFDDGLDAGG